MQDGGRAEDICYIDLQKQFEHMEGVYSYLNSPEVLDGEVSLQIRVSL